MRHGKLDCDDGPAIETNSGRKEWFKNNKIYRKNGEKNWYDSLYTAY